MRMQRVFKMWIKIVLLLCSCLLASSPVLANKEKGMEAELNKFFSGMQTNITQPASAQGQAAGYYTGGSLYARTPVRRVHLAHIDLPQYRAGCGGIDFYTGAVSFIRKDELITLGKNIMNNAQGYAFQLALDTVSPQISNNLSRFRDIVTKINQANIQSCETAQALVGGMWAKNTAANRQICTDLNANSGPLADWASARQRCSSEGGVTDAMTHMPKDSPHKATVLDNVNVVWRALQKDTLLSNNKELSEFLMSLSGTWVITYNDDAPSDDSKRQVKAFPPLVADGHLLQALLYGGKASIYRCDSEKDCLAPTLSEEVLMDYTDSLYGQISKLLAEMVFYKQDDTPLNDDMKGLLEATSLPVGKMIDVMVGEMGDKAVGMVSRYADIIAIDLVYVYLHESLIEVQQIMLSGVNVENIEKMQEGLHNAEQQLATISAMASAKLRLRHQLIDETKLLENKLATEATSMLANHRQWSRGK